MRTSNTDHARKTRKRSATGYKDAEGPLREHHWGGYNVPNEKDASLFAACLRPKKTDQIFPGKVQNLNAKEAVVQIDFAENNTCFQPDEIQAARWSQEQVTLFPVVIWSKIGENKAMCNSYAIVSDDHSHEKKSVAVFMDEVLSTFVKEKILMFKKFTFSQTHHVRNLRTSIWSSFFTLFRRI